MGEMNGHTPHPGPNDGVIALITGSSSGNGRSIALAFAATGAKVICADLKPDHPVRNCLGVIESVELLLRHSALLQAGDAATHKLIQSSGTPCIFLPLDVTNDEDWQRATATAVERFDRIDV